MKKKTILILGVSSFVGSNLAEFLKHDFRVIGTYYKNKISINGILCIPLDINTKEAIQLLIYSFRPDITIYCVGLTSVADCSDDERTADKLNALGVYNVSTYTERFKSKICYISSSLIFSGSSKNYSENDTPDPTTQYGKSKAAAEFYIQKSCLNYVIFRCCPLYGRGINSRNSTFLETLERKIFLGSNLNCDGKLSFGHIDVYYLAMIIKMTIKKNVTNRLFHLSSKDSMTYYDFSKKYAQIFSQNSSLIAKGAWNYPEEKGFDPDSIDHVTGERKLALNAENLESYFRIQLPTIEESLRMSLYRLSRGKSFTAAGQVKSVINYI